MTATMIKEFRLPDLGEGLTESEIVSWKVGVGDTVSLNQIIAEVETAKAVVELPSPFAGVITALHEQPGTVVEVGKPIVSFEVKDDAGNQTAAAAPAEAALPKREPNLVGYGAVVESTGRPVRRQRTLVQPTPVAEPGGPAPVVEPVPPRWLSLSKPGQHSRAPPFHAARPEAGQGPRSRPGECSGERPQRSHYP
jgi:2-oxoisovalerate dehydrogenase E2 component (dihydrolipoyl transacylase)